MRDTLFNPASLISSSFQYTHKPWEIVFIIEPQVIMKTPLKFTVVFSVALIFGAIVTKTTLSQSELPAPIQSPVPVVDQPAPKQYKVIDMGRVPVMKGQTVAGTLEILLNEMGSNGWRVVTTSGNLVIMMQ